MGKYSQFKKRVLEANLSLVGIGTGLAWTFAGDGTALDFAYGGAGGLIYMSLLQHGADALPLSNASPDGQVNMILSSHSDAILGMGYFFECKAVTGTKQFSYTSRILICAS